MIGFDWEFYYIKIGTRGTDVEGWDQMMDSLKN